MSDEPDRPPVVLVVEDEPIIRMNAVEILAENGYATAEAADAAGALEILADRSDVRVLFTDVNMPGELTGVELAAEVHARWPNVLLLVTSGHAMLSNADVPDHGDFVQKPYGAAELLRRVRSLLAVSPAAHSARDGGNSD